LLQKQSLWATLKMLASELAGVVEKQFHALVATVKRHESSAMAAVFRLLKALLVLPSAGCVGLAAKPVRSIRERMDSAECRWN
jgi:hypothetical protein